MNNLLLSPDIAQLMDSEYCYVRRKVNIVLDGIELPEECALFNQDGRFMAHSEDSSMVFFFATNNGFEIVTIH